jgi:hypothetical protein
LNCCSSSKKLLLGLPCVRTITDASLYREQDKPTEFFSRRWPTFDLVDITDWASDEIVTVEITHIFRHFPYRAELRRFVPREGDVISEPWTDNQGNLKTHYIPPYAIADMKKHATTLRRWIESSVWQYIEGLVDPSNLLLCKTYLAAFRHIGGAKEECERRLISDAFRLWATCCSCCHPTQLTGNETLDIGEVTDPSSPWYKSRPDPPLMTPQEECIYYTELLRPFSKTVLDQLQAIVFSNKMKHWWTIYLTMFILLHCCSIVTRRDAEFAAQISLLVTLYHTSQYRKSR